MKNSSGVFSLLFFSFIGAAGAQITGDVKGVVTDPSGGFVAQAKLTLTSLETGQARVQTADTRAGSLSTSWAPAITS